MARKLIVEILGDTSGLERGFRRARGETEALGGAVGKLRIGFASLAKATIFIEAVDKALEGLHATIHAGIDEVKERAVIQAQLNAVLKSTGDVANVSVEHIDKLALSLSNLSGIDDEVVKGGEATILTFTNIRNFAGRGNDVFDRATKAAVDFSAKTGKSVTQASLAIGRALQDPAKAATGLRRAQLVLTSSEKQAIAVAIRHRDTLAAQRVVLDALAKRYGGQAKALGQTLPGQINILRERFRDLAGDIGDKLSPGLASAVHGLTGFVTQLSEASGARAKLKVVFEGIEDLGRNLVDLARRGIRAAVARIESIDWGEVRANLRIGFERGREIASRLYDEARAGIAAGIDRLRQVDWKGQIDRAARVVGDALVTSLTAIRHLLDRVNWNQVGRAIAIGIGAALGATIRFLARLPWGKIIDALGRLIVAALRAAGQLFVGIGTEIGKLIMRGIEAGIHAIGVQIEKWALELVLVLLQPFSKLPKGLGQWARDLKDSVNATLDSLKPAASKKGEETGKVYLVGFEKGMGAGASHGGGGGLGAAASAAVPDPTNLPPPPPAGGTRRNRQRVIDLRNQWFDNRIARQLDRVQDIPSIKGQIARLGQIAQMIRDRIAITKDITRRLDLEDRLLGVLRQTKALRETLAQNLGEVLQFNIEKAGTTKGMADDIRALRRYESYLEARIKVEGRTLDLTRQLFQTRQQIAEARRAQREARQFNVIGLGPTGETLAQGAGTLRSRFGVLSKAIKGTVLDTPHMRSVFANVRKLLSGQFGKLGEDVRQAIQKILDDVDDQLKKHRTDVTKFAVVDPQAFLAAVGLKLTPAQYRKFKEQFSTIGPGGVVPASSGQYAAAGAKAGPTQIVINGGVHVHNIANPTGFEDELVKRAKQRPHRRRGAR